MLSIPSWLDWLVEILGMQHWPKGNEDLMRVIEEAWAEVAKALRQLPQEISGVMNSVLDSFSGPAAEQFGQYMRQMQNSFEPMAEGADEVSTSAKNFALNVETTKYMILFQMILTAEQIAELAASLWGAPAIPAVEAAARLTMAKIARRLLEAVAAGVISQVGINAAVQGIEFLKGDRTSWDWGSTLTSLEMGALAGGVSGALHLGVGAVAPDFAKSIAGSVATGAVDGVINMEAANLAFGGDMSLGLGAAGGAVGGLIGGARGRTSGGGRTAPIKIGDIDIPRPPEFGEDGFGNTKTDDFGDISTTGGNDRDDSGNGSIITSTDGTGTAGTEKGTGTGGDDLAGVSLTGNGALGGGRRSDVGDDTLADDSASPKGLPGLGGHEPTEEDVTPGDADTVTDAATHVPAQTRDGPVGTGSEITAPPRPAESGQPGPAEGARPAAVRLSTESTAPGAGRAVGGIAARGESGGPHETAVGESGSTAGHAVRAPGDETSSHGAGNDTQVSRVPHDEVTSHASPFTRPIDDENGAVRPVSPAADHKDLAAGGRLSAGPPADHHQAQPEHQADNYGVTARPNDERGAGVSEPSARHAPAVGAGTAPPGERPDSSGDYGISRDHVPGPEQRSNVVEPPSRSIWPRIAAGGEHAGPGLAREGSSGSGPDEAFAETGPVSIPQARSSDTGVMSGGPVPSTGDHVAPGTGSAQPARGPSEPEPGPGPVRLSAGDRPGAIGEPGHGSIGDLESTEAKVPDTVTSGPEPASRDVSQGGQEITGSRQGDVPAPGPRPSAPVARANGNTAAGADSGAPSPRGEGMTGADDLTSGRGLRNLTNDVAIEVRKLGGDPDRVVTEAGVKDLAERYGKIRDTKSLVSWIAPRAINPEYRGYLGGARGPEHVSAGESSRSGAVTGGGKRQRDDDPVGPPPKRARGDQHNDASDAGSRGHDALVHQLNAVDLSHPGRVNVANAHFDSMVDDQPSALNEDRYQDLVADSADNQRPLSYVVNSILPVADIDKIPHVVNAIMDGSGKGASHVGFVFGINARAGDEGVLNHAFEERLPEIIKDIPYPVSAVRITFTGKSFPHGSVRNDTLHSPQTKGLVSAFTAKGSHPYISIQDFDDGSRTVLSGDHVFDHFEKKLNAGESPALRPLLMAGGYRVDRGAGSGGQDHDGMVVDPSGHGDHGDAMDIDHDGLMNIDLGEQVHGADSGGRDHDADFADHVDEDMMVRDRLAKTHPLLPYGPEPNLFVDGTLLLKGADIHFGSGSAEFGQLADSINKTYAAELGHHYAGSGDVANGLSRDAANGTHPTRGKAFVTDYRDGATLTDLGRLKSGFESAGENKNSLPQNHVTLGDVRNQFFGDRAKQKGISLSRARDEFNKAPADDDPIHVNSGPRPGAEASGSRVGQRWNPPGKYGGNLSEKKSPPLASRVSAPLGNGHSGRAGLQPSERTIGAFNVATSDHPSAYTRDLHSIKDILASQHTPVAGGSLYDAVHRATGESSPEGLRDGAVDTALSQLGNERGKNNLTDQPLILQRVRQPFGPGHFVNAVVQHRNQAADDGTETAEADHAWEFGGRLIATHLQRNIVINRADGERVSLTPFTGDARGGPEITLSQHVQGGHRVYEPAGAPSPRGEGMTGADDLTSGRGLRNLTNDVAIEVRKLGGDPDRVVTEAGVKDLAERYGKIRDTKSLVNWIAPRAINPEYRGYLGGARGPEHVSAGESSRSGTARPGVRGASHLEPIAEEPEPQHAAPPDEHEDPGTVLPELPRVPAHEPFNDAELHERLADLKLSGAGMGHQEERSWRGRLHTAWSRGTEADLEKVNEALSDRLSELRAEQRAARFQRERADDAGMPAEERDKWAADIRAAAASGDQARTMSLVDARNARLDELDQIKKAQEDSGLGADLPRRLEALRGGNDEIKNGVPSPPGHDLSDRDAADHEADDHEPEHDDPEHQDLLTRFNRLKQTDESTGQASARLPGPRSQLAGRGEEAERPAGADERGSRTRSPDTVRTPKPVERESAHGPFGSMVKQKPMFLRPSPRSDADEEVKATEPGPVPEHLKDLSTLHRGADDQDHRDVDTRDHEHDRRDDDRDRRDDDTRREDKGKQKANTDDETAPGHDQDPSHDHQDERDNEPEPEPPVPWYARGHDNLHAFGDAEVTGVRRATDAAGNARTAVNKIKDAVQGARNRGGLKISDGLVKKLTSGITKALDSDDARQWEELLHTGLVEGDGHTVVRAWFSLEPRPGGADHGDVPMAGKHAVLSPYRSKYGDVTFSRTTNKTHSSSHVLPGDVLFDGVGSSTFVGVDAEVTLRSTRTDGHASSDEVQAGSRPIVNGSAAGGYGVRVDLFALSAHAPNGVTAHHDVTGMVVGVNHPQPLTTEAQAEGQRPIAVTNAAGVEAFKTTFGAIDSRPLEKQFLAGLLSSNVTSADKAAEVAADAVKETIGEKPLRDRSRYMPGGMPSNFTASKGVIRLRGFNGYVRMKSTVVAVEPIGEVKGDNRDDVAETVTVLGGTGHGNSFQFRAGMAAGLPHSVTATGHPISVGTESHYATRSSLQAQPKTAIIDSGGNLRRYKAVIRVDGEMHADRKLGYDSHDDTVTYSKPVTKFSADLDGELLVPAAHADAFEAKIQEAPAPRDEPYAPAPAMNRDKADRLAQAFGPLRSQPSRAIGHLLHAPGLVRQKDAGGDLFPADGLHSNTEFLQHVRQTATADKPVTLRVPEGYLDDSSATDPHRFSNAQLHELAQLHQDGKVRLMEETGNSVRELSPEAPPARSEHEQAPAGPPGTEGTELGDLRPQGWHREPAVPGERIGENLGTRGYGLDGRGVHYGWERAQAQPNPPRPAPGTTVAHPAGTTTAGGSREPVPDKTIENILAEPRPDGTPIAVITGPRPDLLTSHDQLDGGYQAGTLWRPSGSAHASLTGDLLTKDDLPDTGYVMSPGGKAAWGWRDSGFPAVPGKESADGAGLASLIRESEHTGLQLVVNPRSDFAGELRTAAAEVRDARRPAGPSGPAVGGSGAGHAVASKETTGERFIQAGRDGDGALAGVGKQDLLHMLVSSRKVRIVDEDGVIHGDLHANPLPASAKMGQEYAVRADGRIGKSVAWGKDGAEIPYTRRARYGADPFAETPELAAGVGFGSAAVMETPGAERVHQEIRSTIVKMVSDDYSAGPAAAGGKTTRHEKLSAYNRFSLDKQLQTAFSAPKLRAARSRAADGAVRETFRVGGRKYIVSVTQTLDERAPEIGTRSNIAVDHQAKGTRAGTVETSKSWSAGADFAGAARVGAKKDPVSGDLGDFTLSGKYTRGKITSWGNQAKHYSRMRSPGGAAAKASIPDYPVRYQYTVTEIRGKVRTAPLGEGTTFSRLSQQVRSAIKGRPKSAPIGGSETTSRLFQGARSIRGGGNRRVISRLVDGDDVRVPPIVHSAFRPSELEGDAAQKYTAAFNHVTSTIGRTTRFEDDDPALEHLRANRIDFSETGISGLHGFFAGLKDSVAGAHQLVAEHARESGQYGKIDRRTGRSPIPEGDTSLRAPQIERVLTEGFLRANMHRLLSPHGIPVPLPKEYHSEWMHEPSDLVTPHVNRSLTVRGFLVDADEAAGHWAPKAGNESYAEWDVKLNGERENTVGMTFAGAVGPVIRIGPAPEESGLSSSRRAVENRVGFALEGDVSANLYSKAKTETGGSIDVSLLSEKSGMQVKRAHLVLELTSTRQAVGQSRLRGKAQQTLLHDPFETSVKKTALLIENSAELSVSKTLDGDLRNPQQLQPVPAQQAERHITKPAAAYSASFSTHLDDSKAQFTATAAGGRQLDPPAEPGIVNSIRHGLKTTGLMGDEHLNDTSDTWRAITAKYNPEELQTHPDDLRGAGVVHRAQVPVFGGGTRQVTIVATAKERGAKWVRTREAGSVTFGGQSLRQEGERTTKRLAGHAAGSAYGIYTQDANSYGELGGGGGLGREKSASFGSETVLRHIIRTTARAEDPPPADAKPAETKPGETKPAGAGSSTLKPPVDGTKGGDDEAVLDQAKGEGNGEEFSDKLDVEIKIYSHTTWPEPVSRFQQLSASGPHPEPAVTLASRTDDPGGGVGTRRVVPRQLTEPGPPPVRTEDGQAPEAHPEPQAQVRFSPEPAAPSMIDHELGEKMIALSFPDLHEVAKWAPTATLGRDSAQEAVHSSIPQTGSKYAPTADRGYHVLQSLASRHVRDNSQNFFEHKLSLSPPGDDGLKAGVRIRGVMRPVGKPGRYNGLNFHERADEPTYTQNSSSSKSAEMMLGGGSREGVGLPAYSPEPSTEHESTAFSGDYTEYNRKFDDRVLFSYEADATYDITGTRDHTVNVDPTKPIQGLLVDTWAEELAGKFPTMVIHPRATELPVDDVARDQAVGTIAGRVTSAPTDDDPVRLFADSGDGSKHDDYIQAAQDLAVRLGRDGHGGPVDLALIQHRPDGTSYLEHHTFGPDDYQSRQWLDQVEEMRGQRDQASRQADADLAQARAGAAPVFQREHTAQQEFDESDEWVRQHGGREALAQSLDAANARADKIERNSNAAERGGDARGAAQGRQRAADVRAEAAQTQRRLNEHTGRANALQTAGRAADTERERIRVASDRAENAARDLRDANEARDAETQRAAAARAEADRDTAERIASAEHGHPLTGTGHSPAEVVSAAWRETSSGIALPDSDADLAAANRLPQLTNTRTIALGRDSAPNQDGYQIRGERVPADQLANEIVSRLAAEGTPPRWLILHGDGTDDLARALSSRFIDHTVEVVGVRGGVTQLTARSGFSSLVHRLSPGTAPRWVAYRDGHEVLSGTTGDVHGIMNALGARSHTIGQPPSRSFWSGLQSAPKQRFGTQSPVRRPSAATEPPPVRQAPPARETPVITVTEPHRDTPVVTDTPAVRDTPAAREIPVIRVTPPPPHDTVHAGRRDDTDSQARGTPLALDKGKTREGAPSRTQAGGDHVDTMAEYLSAGEELARATQAHEQLNDLVTNAGSSHDPQRAVENEQMLVDAIKKMAEAEERMRAAGLGDLSGRDDPRLPERLRSMPAQDFLDVMHRADQMLGRPTLDSAGDRALREAQFEARARVAEALAAGDTEHARRLAADLSGPAGFTHEGQAGGAVTVGGWNMTEDFRARMKDIDREVRAEIIGELDDMQERVSNLVTAVRRLDERKESITELADQQRAELRNREQAARDYLAEQQARYAVRYDQFGTQVHSAAPEYAEVASHSLTRMSDSVDEAQRRAGEVLAETVGERARLDQRVRQELQSLRQRRAELMQRRDQAAEEYRQRNLGVDEEISQRTARQGREVLAWYLNEFRRALSAEHQPGMHGVRKLSRDEQDHLRDIIRDVDRRLARLIVEPTGYRGYHPILGHTVGSHPDFGAKMANVHVDSMTDLARGAMGWVDAKPARHQEKLLAQRIEEEGHVEPLIDTLLTRASKFIDAHPSAAAIRRELAAGRNESDKSLLGTYLPYFRRQPGIPDRLRPTGQKWDAGMLGALERPDAFTLREKMMVWHDLTEYFGVGRHTTRTRGAGVVKDEPRESFLSTVYVDEHGWRIASQLGRGQNPVRGQFGGSKVHASTRDEDSALTKLARERKIPVWAGESNRATRMYLLAQTVGGTPREIGAVGWGIFSFWRLHYDHRNKLAYHTLHETLDRTQNFGVPYSVSDQQASLRHISVAATLTDARGLADDLAAGRIAGAPGDEGDTRSEGSDDTVRPGSRQTENEQWAASIRRAADGLDEAYWETERRDALIELLDRVRDARKHYGLDAGLPRGVPEPVQQEGDQ